MTLRHIKLLPATTIGAAVTGAISPAAATAELPVLLKNTGGAKAVTAQAKFLYGAGGTTVKAWIQTTFDGGASWVDIMCFAFLLAAATKISKVSTYVALAAALVPTDGTLADDTIKDGVLGTQFRVKYTSTGTYTGATSLEIDLALSTDAP